MKAAAYLSIPALDSQSGLVHGFSRLEHGSMRRPPDSPSVATPARRALAAGLGADAERLPGAGAVPSDEVDQGGTPKGGGERSGDLRGYSLAKGCIDVPDDVLTALSELVP